MHDEGWHSTRQCSWPPFIFKTLPSVITAGTLLQYADDTTLICSNNVCGSNNFPVAAATMNYQLQLVHSWIFDSKMERNSKKCGFCSLAIVDAL